MMTLNIEKKEEDSGNPVIRKIRRNRRKRKTVKENLVENLATLFHYKEEYFFPVDHYIN